MKAGFWEAPEGADDAMTIMPLDLGDDATRPASGAVSFLATADGAALAARCRQAAALLPEVAAALDGQSARATGRLCDGDLAVMTAFGTGFTWAAQVLRV